MPGEGVLVLVAAASLPFLAIWTYSDAKRNSPHSASLWALVVFFGSLLGILLYFLVGRTGRGGRRHGHSGY